MPKDGYVSVTFPTWILEAASVIMPPGQTLQAFILNNLLVPNISKKQLREIYDKWVSEHYPFGGTKPFENSESEVKNDSN